jgi:hypothetical protein
MQRLNLSFSWPCSFACARMSLRSASRVNAIVLSCRDLGEKVNTADSKQQQLYLQRAFQGAQISSRVSRKLRSNALHKLQNIDTTIVAIILLSNDRSRKANAEKLVLIKRCRQPPVIVSGQRISYKLQYSISLLARLLGSGIDNIEFKQWIWTVFVVAGDQVVGSSRKHRK